MKIFKIKLIIIILFIPFWVFSQSLNCPSTLTMRVASAPYKFNNLSKSAQCLTGNKYEFVLTLNKGKDYKISFYASPVFNNNIKFKIIDLSTNQIVLDLPGETENSMKGECVLKAYFDDKQGKEVHPSFNFYPDNTTSLKIIIDVASIEGNKENSESGFNAPEEKQKGCVTVFIQDRLAENQGF
ncbi:MAG: hypothetical protein JXR51_14840 [Bacteroidales bacterium]|nr:hypothetical protein [Bacteroidales bacterium]MBN2758447.1 hypothetical protein [Bacteroidales bacterium]